MSIMLVEPASDDRKVMEETLRQGGYSDLVMPKTLEDAFEMLGLGDGAAPKAYGIDLIVVGAANADESADVCRAIKKSFHYQDVPIVIAAAGAAVAGMPAAFAAGAVDYVRKPLTDYEFLARVRAAVRLKHEIDRRKAREHELLEATRQLTDLNTMLTRLSLIDSLTSAGNRRHFDRALDKEWRRAFRAKHPLSLIMIDVDFFKPYNDHYGHQGGDHCLKQVAHALKDILRRPGDLLCRYGGEEFSVILPDTPIAGAKIVAENLRLAVEQAKIPHAKSKVGNYVTLSLGVACIVPNDGEKSNALIEAADKALYKAKEGGRNKVEI